MELKDKVCIVTGGSGGIGYAICERFLQEGAKVILMSHLGRPEGKPDKKYSLKVVSERLQELLPNNKVIMAKDVVGEDAKTKASKLKIGEVLLIEHLRFDAREEENDKEFCKELASLGVWNCTQKARIDLWCC